MSLFFGEHVENVGGRSFRYNLDDVRKHYLSILQNEMGCHSFKQVSSNEYFCKTSMSFKFNMNPGQAEIFFVDNGNGVDAKIKVRIGQQAFARTEAWINKGFDLLESALSSCTPYKKETPDFVETNEIQVTCPSCGNKFVISKDMASCFCTKCGTKLVRK